MSEDKNNSENLDGLSIAELAQLKINTTEVLKFIVICRKIVDNCNVGKYDKFELNAIHKELKIQHEELSLLCHDNKHFLEHNYLLVQSLTAIEKTLKEL